MRGPTYARAPQGRRRLPGALVPSFEQLAAGELVCRLSTCNEQAGGLLGALARRAPADPHPPHPPGPRVRLPVYESADDRRRAAE
jgi:hypothetical protein